MRTWFRLLGWSLLSIQVLVLGACAHASSPKDLRSILEGFNHDVRWKFNQAAVGVVDPAHARAFLDVLEDLKEDLNISDWEIRDVVVSPDGHSASVRVQYRYYLMPSTVLEKKTVEQTWKNLGGQWCLMEQKGGPFEFPPVEEDQKTEADEPPTPPAGP